MDEREQVREWVERWKAAEPRLEEIRMREIRELDTHRVLAILEPAFNHALRTLPPRSSSGMVEMQYWFRKLREKQLADAAAAAKADGPKPSSDGATS